MPVVSMGKHMLCAEGQQKNNNNHYYGRGLVFVRLVPIPRSWYDHYIDLQGSKPKTHIFRLDLQLLNRYRFFRFRFRLKVNGLPFIRFSISISVLNTGFSSPAVHPSKYYITVEKLVYLIIKKHQFPSPGKR